jgi:acetyl-CoA acetyltransferase
MTEREAVVVAGVRTPQGKENGVYADVRSEQLSVPLVNELLDRTGVDPTDVELAGNTTAFRVAALGAVVLTIWITFFALATRAEKALIST